MADDLLTIGDLARRTGVAPSALRYYEELGLVEPATRRSGQRRYTEAAVAIVGVVLFLREVGFTLAEIRLLVDGRADDPSGWRGMAVRKIGELERQVARVSAAKTALEHAIDCPKPDVLECPNFWTVVGGLLEGRPLAEAHAEAHAPSAFPGSVRARSSERAGRAPGAKPGRSDVRR